jgi:hypothetical protein
MAWQLPKLLNLKSLEIKSESQTAGIDLPTAFGCEVEFAWLRPADTDANSQIIAIHLFVPIGVERVN